MNTVQKSAHHASVVLPRLTICELEDADGKKDNNERVDKLFLCQLRLLKFSLQGCASSNTNSWVI